MGSRMSKFIGVVYILISNLSLIMGSGISKVLEKKCSYKGALNIGYPFGDILACFVAEYIEITSF